MTESEVRLDALENTPLALHRPLDCSAFPFRAQGAARPGFTSGSEWTTFLPLSPRKLASADNRPPKHALKFEILSEGCKYPSASCRREISAAVKDKETVERISDTSIGGVGLLGWRLCCSERLTTVSRPLCAQLRAQRCRVCRIWKRPPTRCSRTIASPWQV